MDSMQTGKQKVERPDQHCKVQVLAYPLLRKAIRSLGAGHRYVASRNDGEKLLFVVIS